LLFVRLRKTRQPVDTPLDSHPIPRFDVMGLASQLVAGSGRLFGGEIALLPLNAIEECSRNVFFGATNHCTNIQITCINMQCHLMGKTPNRKIQFIKRVGNLESTQRRKRQCCLLQFYLHFFVSV